VSQPDTLIWLASHELRLGWRDWIAVMTAGPRNRVRNLVVALAIFAGFVHLLAYSTVGRYAGARIAPDKATLLVASGCGPCFCRKRWSWLHVFFIRALTLISF
jgi:ABC-2 type transport system permease protein